MGIRSITPKLDRWVIYGNCIVGYIYDDRHFPPGTRVVTEAIRFVDISNFSAECLDGKYKLGEPGTQAEHNMELIGVKPEASLPKVDARIFLNPKG